MAYATVAEVEAGFRPLDSDEQALASSLLEEAAVIIDNFNETIDVSVKKLVSCRMVRRSIGDGDLFPMGATQGSMSAGGYTQSWTVGGGGSTGELYLSKLEKKMLGVGNRIGSHSPLEELV